MLARPLLHDPSHCVWLIPTPEFRLAAFESRGTMWSIPNETSYQQALPSVSRHSLGLGCVRQVYLKRALVHLAM
jgi:hypothetical protein